VIRFMNSQQFSHGRLDERVQNPMLGGV